MRIEAPSIHRVGGVSAREEPRRLRCLLYRVNAHTNGSLPIDQCYKMEPARRYRGVWVDEFENQQFIPEGSTAPEWPGAERTLPGWDEQFDRAQAASIWLDVSRVSLDDHDYRQGGRKMFIEFVGRKTLYPGTYGHLGMSGNEIIVDHVISLKALD